MSSLSFNVEELKIKVHNLDDLTVFPTLEGCLVNRINNPADHGMAFDSALSDFIITFLGGVSSILVSDYLINVLKYQRDNRGPRNVYIANQTINVNSISNEELERLVNKLVKDKFKESQKEDV
ncbi:hypothetical protein [Acinetobacter haemolyticus]|uniref:hypothetical protein n=1 Tax=Acinetobacter haemolyticus TaxID=29430 RepID=UPI002DBCBC37|nr:hypothetical protein [Acinetobacter haemolyticus]MEB6677689.1 hypothetical protein [Acinetobacter haemolyticus]